MVSPILCTSTNNSTTIEPGLVKKSFKGETNALIRAIAPRFARRTRRTVVGTYDQRHQSGAGTVPAARRRYSPHRPVRIRAATVSAITAATAVPIRHPY